MTSLQLSCIRDAPHDFQGQSRSVTTDPATPTPTIPREYPCNLLRAHQFEVTTLAHVKVFAQSHASRARTSQLSDGPAHRTTDLIECDAAEHTCLALPRIGAGRVRSKIEARGLSTGSGRSARSPH
jgi:hypothetical protein